MSQDVAKSITARLQMYGYGVYEDPSHPGMFRWALEDRHGRTLEECGLSFGSEAEAWEDAERAASGDIMQAPEISDERWDAIVLEQQQLSSDSR